MSQALRMSSASPKLNFPFLEHAEATYLFPALRVPRLKTLPPVSPPPRLSKVPCPTPPLWAPPSFSLGLTSRSLFLCNFGPPGCLRSSALSFQSSRRSPPLQNPQGLIEPPNYWSGQFPQDLAAALSPEVCVCGGGCPFVRQRIPSPQLHTSLLLGFLPIAISPSPVTFSF